MKHKIKVLIFLLVITVTVYGQETDTIKTLKGEWYAYKKTTLQDQSLEVNLILNFVNDTTVNFKESNVDNNVNYTINNNAITIANKEYLIVSISNNELTLKEENPLGGILYFEKTETEQY